MTCTVAIDAMGGDRAPGEIVRGAVEAARSDADLRLLLVGRQELIRAELDALASATAVSGQLEIVHAEGVVGMGDSPVEALRRNRGSSIEVMAKLLKEGKASAMLSAGNTGACVAAATLILGLLPGVKRAGIAVVLPAGEQPVVVIDAGANVSPRAIHMLQYGLMANLYALDVLRIDRPRVGLLNIGAESEKGHALVKSTHALFDQTDLHYVGNVEGGDIFNGGCHVVVCDGFVGNVVLKVAEGLAERLMVVFSDFVRGLPRSAPGQHASDGSSSTRLESLARRFHYSEYGGAPLLGVHGVTIIAHGRSDHRAIANAIGFATRMVDTNLNRKISAAVRQIDAE